MDTITAVIVTAFLNLAISTGIFLRVQKNIELSFEKQLEEFKSTLQKELEIFKTELHRAVIEHQIKFSRTYPKTLEVLELLTEKYRSYESSCIECPGLLSEHLSPK